MNDRDSSVDWEALYGKHLEEWERRFSAALDACQYEAVLIFSGPEQHRARDDESYPFVAEPYFKAWLPLTQHPGSALKIVPGERPLLVCTQPADYWHAPPKDPEGWWVKHFDVHRVSSAADVADALGTHTPRVAAIGDSAGAKIEAETVSNPPRLLDYLDYFRAFKTPYEVACMEQANALAAAGHAAAERAFRDGASEFELSQIYCSATLQRESELPYRSIVALNEHAAVLHYQHLDRQAPTDRFSFLIDAGADFRGYAADISRTYSAGDELFDSLIESLDRMQRLLCSEASGGVDFTDLNEQAHQALAGILREHRIVKCSEEEAYARGVTRYFLPHGLGHLLGLQVHDAGGRLVSPEGQRQAPPDAHPALRLTRTLDPGFVLTVEPGVYFIPSLLERLGNGDLRPQIDWTRVALLVPFGGIRIEDNVLITESGARNLTRPALAAQEISRSARNRDRAD
jgi:Xaa-Pro dipeptidase